MMLCAYRFCAGWVARRLARAAWLIGMVGMPATAQDLLPGEMQIEFSRELVEPARFPTLRELSDHLAQPEQSAALAFRFYRDRHNHFAPQWSPDGRALSVLRSDIEAHTSKIVLFPALDATRPMPLYGDSDSYDHMFAWANDGSRTFVFASTNEPSEQENLHLAALGEPIRPARITAGPGVKTHPSMWLDGGRGRILYNASGKLCQLQVELSQAGPAAAEPLLDGTEARWAPQGRLIAWIERHDLGASLSSSALKLRDGERGVDRRLFAQPGVVVRNPTWSPDGHWIAFYARPARQPVWRLYVVSSSTHGAAEPDPKDDRPAAAQFGGSSKAILIAQDVRAEEHFLNFGPAWGPRSDQLWFFTKAQDQEYYPLRWASLDGQASGEVAYPRKLTTGLDVAVNPDPNRRALAFCAIEDLSQDVLVLLLSHEP
jgi:hypothetical protein